MLDIERISFAYSQEASRDFVGLWEIASDVAHELGSEDQLKVRSYTLAVVAGLVARGVYPVDYTTEGVAFWSGTPDDHVNRIETEWSMAGESPTLAEPICWFALRSPESTQAK